MGGLALLLAAAVAVVTGGAPLTGETARADGGNWPPFRGKCASGVADGMILPEEWNGETGANILWKTAIPGLAHSSPVVWGHRLFVTTAVSSRPEATFKPGLYGADTASEDRTVHQMHVPGTDHVFAVGR